MQYEGGNQRQPFSDKNLLSKEGLSSAVSYLYSLDFNSITEFYGKTLLRISTFSSLIQLLTFIMLIPSYSSLISSDTEILLAALIPILHTLSLINDLFSALSLHLSDPKSIKKSLAFSLSIFFLFLLFLLLLFYNTTQRPELQQSSHPLKLSYYSIYSTINIICMFVLFFIYQILRFLFLWKAYNHCEQLLANQNT